MIKTAEKWYYSERSVKAVCRNTAAGGILFICCFLLFSSCGLDEYYSLSAPTVRYNEPFYDTADYSSKYFEFRTEEDSMSDYLADDSSFKFLGTAVYYKIYNNYSTMSTQMSAISTLDSSTYYPQGAEKMIETYGYKQLGTSSGSITPLIKATGTDRKIYIRLMNYGSEDEYAAKITVTGTELATPLRDGNTYTFDFGRTSSSTVNAVPTSSDDDVAYSSTFTSSGVWYVTLYAVAVGRDATYSTSYSKTLYLGTVAIDSSSTDN